MRKILFTLAACLIAPPMAQAQDGGSEAYQLIHEGAFAAAQASRASLPTSHALANATAFAAYADQWADEALSSSGTLAKEYWSLAAGWAFDAFYYALIAYEDDPSDPYTAYAVNLLYEGFLAAYPLSVGL